MPYKWGTANSPTLQCRNGGSEKINNLLKVVELKVANPETVSSSVLDFKAICLATTPDFLS